MDNWQDIYSCFSDSEEALSTRCVGHGVVVFYGMAKPAQAAWSEHRNSGRYARQTSDKLELPRTG
jgi:hypothetical protein